MLQVVPTLTISALLLLAAWRDVATRLIPDPIALALLITALAFRAQFGWGDLLPSLCTAALLFGALFLLAMRGILGGGDVKLAGALAVAFSPAEAWNFVVATVMTGGLLGSGYMLAARLVPTPASSALPGQDLLSRVIAVEGWRIRRRSPLPYGVAIAAGGIITLLNTWRV